MNNKQLDT